MTYCGVCEAGSFLSKKTFLLSVCMERLIQEINLSVHREWQNKLVLSQQGLAIAPRSRLLVR